MLMASIDAILGHMGITPTQRIFRVDNAAAITLASAEDGGGWRTRHLKVRSQALRERVRDQWMVIEYCPGDQQLADSLTKILPSQRMGMLMRFWGLHDGEETGQDVQLALIVDEEAIKVPLHLPLPQLLQPRGSSSSSTRIPHPVRPPSPDDKTPLAVDMSVELYAVALMAAICVVALWEAGKWCTRPSDVAKLRRLQAELEPKRKLSKAGNAAPEHFTANGSVGDDGE